MQDAVSMQVSNAAEQLMRVADYDVDGKRAVDFKEMGNRSSGHPLGKQINHVGVGVETRAQQSDRVGMAESGCEGTSLKEAMSAPAAIAATAGLLFPPPSQRGICLTAS